MPEVTAVEESKRRGRNDQYVESVMVKERGYCLEYMMLQSTPSTPRQRVCKRPSNPPITITKRGPEPHDRT